MAITTTCPACARKFALPEGFVGGVVVCPDPACARKFSLKIAPSGAAKLQAVKAAKAPAPLIGAEAEAEPEAAFERGAVSALRAAPRGTGSRPELLDRVPTSFLASPAIFAVVPVVALLYGMVLFGMVTARKDRPRPAPEPANPVVIRTPIRLPTAPAPDPSPPTSPTPPETNSATTVAKPSTPTPTPTPTTVAKPEPAKPAVVATTTPAPPVVPTAARTPTPTPSPTPAPERPSGDRWGVLTAVPGDCKFFPDGDGLTVEIPGTLHVLSHDLKTLNAPRMMGEAFKGDFTAEVRVPGKISPGIEPLPGLPFTYQGAGLILWQDDGNYLRLERASSYSAIERKRAHGVLMELCRDGKVAATVFRDAREADLSLRMERRGSEVRCSYSPDGRTWLEVRRQPMSAPDTAVGVSASNASPKPFAARFEGFTIGARTGKGS